MLKALRLPVLLFGLLLPALPSHAESVGFELGPDLGLYSGLYESTQSCRFSCRSVPPLSKSLLEFGQARQEALPPTLNLLVWNIYKGGKAHWAREFATVAPGADLLLLQESALLPEIRAQLVEQSDVAWKMGVSFLMDSGAPNGVATGSRGGTLSSRVLRSPDLEPIVQSPKPGLLTWHRIQGSVKTLLVANIHAINFRDSDALERHLREFESSILTHDGPVIFAGDFNTWSGARRQTMETFMKSLGLEAVRWDRDPRSFLELDHVWVRGFEVQGAQIVETLDGSDHPLLQVVLSTLPN